MCNAITFEVNNGRKLQLIQREHDGETEIVTFDARGERETPGGEATAISPGEFVLLVDYFRQCKREGKEIL